ncbi:sodium/potassium/calcium exchanger 3-like [Leptidea sinapis]|uniref:sodium/potassium/calcium exchanger 3-like n=1 Tax=Leptidea sinapis TaxID=189913 RepID=UPI00214374DE|nr:sodium/potassium/calcium exchanger 3-like [Leptidea sinapis]
MSIFRATKMRRTSCLWACFAYLIYTISAIEDFNFTDADTYLSVVNKNGKEVYVTRNLMYKLNEEDGTWHWTPWLRTRTALQDNVLTELACPEGNSIDSFPDGIFDDEQLRQGGFILYVLFGVYAFTLLAIVCNDYFIPCVELICEDLKIPQNVAAATFMSVATSCPEFFVNVISTFITESDMGIGTIVGSAIFNILGVAAIGGLAAIRPIKIEVRPVTRDALIYMMNVGVLVGIVWDGQVDWYEALILGILYILYFFIMFNSMRLFALYDRIVARCIKPKSEDIVSANGKPIEEGIENKGHNVETPSNDTCTKTTGEIEDVLKPKKSIFRFPKENSLLFRIWWVYTWPLRIVLGFTIPSPVTYRRFYPVAFIMCIIWIGANSYLVSWSMTVIGHTFFIRESVMGMTFLAFGGCLPEACSIFIMSRRGEGGIGVSNALGANSLAILFALGVPWLIKTLTYLGQGAEVTAVFINSSGIDFVVGSLLLAVVCLYLTLVIGRFYLRRTVGAALLVLYVCFITFAILVETGVILHMYIATC